MEMKQLEAEQVAILELTGRFDAYVAPPIADWLDKATNAAPARIIVNLAKVNFIDSTGLATLVQGMKRSRQHGGDLYLCNLQQPVRVIFELTRLNKAIQIFDTPDEALKAFD
jgi:anti-sigma B factor antagonist